MTKNLSILNLPNRQRSSQRVALQNREKATRHWVSASIWETGFAQPVEEMIGVLPLGHSGSTLDGMKPTGSRHREPKHLVLFAGWQRRYRMAFGRSWIASPAFDRPWVGFHQRIGIIGRA
jgi:hypothetical protein